MANPPISFIPQEQDIQLYQGGTVLITVSATDSSNSPLNMTGGTILATIRQTQSRTGTPIATFTVTWTNQTQGQFSLSLSETQTDALTFSGTAYWDLLYQDGNTPQNTYPLCWGTVTMQNDVSY